MDRWTASEYDILRTEIMDVLQEDHPQSVRHVFYRLTDPRLACPVAKDLGGYKKVQRQLLTMRRNGTIPYAWITDMSRKGYHSPVYGSQREFAEAMATLYRSDFWTDGDTYVEVWCESQSLAGVVDGECRRSAVSLYPCKGFASATLTYEAARQIEARLDKRCQYKVAVLYLGDYDPAGLQIPLNVRDELQGHLPAWVDLEFRRLLINEDQIAEFDLPTKPRKKGERRRPELLATVEAESMRAGQSRAILRKQSSPICLTV